jgi:GDPmannose 4,6-dehydratase
MSMKKAIITGVTGQDGAYLSQLLLNKGYKVYGIIRAKNSYQRKNLDYLKIHDNLHLIECDLQNLKEIIHIFKQVMPCEVYNLAAQSSVSYSFQAPIETLQFNINSVLNILEAIRLVNETIKFYQASSSEMFGRVSSLPISENTIFHPLSPYAISKVAAHHIAINYRESYGLFTCCGILFNHESFLRSSSFFIKKLLIGALDIFYNKKEFITFGNLDIKRDFGFSKDYVVAMYLMMQLEKPDDFLICSGTSIKLRIIVEYVFSVLNISHSKIIIDPLLYRPTEIEDIYGTNKKAISILGWNCEANFFKTLDALIKEEMANYEK